MDECEPVIVEGDWGQTQAKTLRNKLQLYFQSKKKSSGGDCRVEAEDGAPRAAVFFRSEEVRERVLARDDHEIIVENQTIKLRLTSGDSLTNNNNEVPDSSTDSKEAEVEPGNDASAANKEGSKSAPGATVVLENINNTSRDLLLMLVENISGQDESCWRLEIIWESNKAVVTFNEAADAEKFLTVSQTSKKLQKYEVSARPLDAATSVRVENLPPTVVKDMLELYFEKTWTEPDSVLMIPEEQAAIITFSDPKVVESICIKEDYDMRSIPIKVYPYYESLGTALYGNERPTWKMPEPFTENVYPIIWKFLQEKKLCKSINDQMRPHFCRVDLKEPQVTLSPMPSLLRQQSLTEKDIDNWMGKTQHAFRHVMSQYSAFECPVNAPAWKAAEKDVHSVVMEDAILVVDESKGVVTIAGGADDIKRIKAPVENIILKAMVHIDRQTNSISEQMQLSPALFSILKQDGLQKVALDISPKMTLSYDESTQKLTIAGLPTEVFKMKSWILERNSLTNNSNNKVSVVLENINNTSRDLLLMLVENISGQDESCWRLEIIWESNKAVVTFNEAADAEKFLTVSQTSKKLQKYEVSARPLDAATSVRVENLPPTVVKDMLELYFEKTWTEPDSVVMIPEEQAAIITFSDPKVVVSICIKEDYDIRSIPIKVYPYYESLGTALYGNERPTWKMPETFTENVYPIIWKFLQEKKLCKSINDQMRPHFCRVDLKEPQVTLSPMPSFLKQRSLTAKDIDNWMGKTQHAFRHVMSQYSAFECPVNAPAWKAAEKDVHSVVMEDAILVVDESKRVVTIAGQADDIKRIKAPVENIILKAMVPIDQQTNSISEEMQLSPAFFYILKQDGLQKNALDISPEMTLSYDESTQKLTIAGLPTEVFKMKSWILERNVNMSKKHLYIPPSLLDFLRSVDPMDMSQDLFTSQGISAIYSVDSKGVFLLGSSDKILADAESKMKAVLSVNTLDVEDQEVMKLQGWVDLNQQLLDTYNSSKKKTVAVQFHPERRDKITVAGFTNPVKEASSSLSEFIMNYSTIQEKLRVESCAVVQFIDRKKTHDWSSIAKANDVKVLFDPERPRIFITGARLHVHKAKSSFQQLVSTLFTDTLTVDKPGAKKYFQSQGSLLLSTIMSEFSCVVTLGSEFEDEPEGHNRLGKEELYSRMRMRTVIRPANSKTMDCSTKEVSSRSAPRKFPLKKIIQSPARQLGKEVDLYSHIRTSQHVSKVSAIIPPTSYFTREVSGRSALRTVPLKKVFQSPARQPLQSITASGPASFSPVLSPSLGVYRMQMGQLTLEVSSGDITKETSDVIVNSSNQTFNLNAGVSKAILDSAGSTVLLECSQIVNSPGYQPCPMILTSAGQLPCGNIIHIVGVNDPARIKEMVYEVLKVCEENKFSSISFPALGTGQGGANPSAVADAMVGAVVDFVRKKHQRFVHSVKILIFQTAMIAEFHKSMKKREGEEVEEKSVLSNIKDRFTSLFSGFTEEQPRAEGLVLESEEFEPTVFQLCADDNKAVTLAKKRINELIVAEQAERTIQDMYIGHLSQADISELNALQKKLTVSIRLDRGQEEQEPKIHLEGLTRDVFTAESAVRDIIRRVERAENQKSKALLASGLVEWQFLDTNTGKMEPFDIYTNLKLEEALEKKQNLEVKINNEKYTADPMLKSARSLKKGKQVELFRKDLKDDAALPSHWDDMKGDIEKLFPVAQGSQEYNDVETEFTKTGLTANIISIERVQNTTLWQSYQLMKKQMEVKNKHKNNERLLFHGTCSTAIDLINKQGFNRSYAGTRVGARFGNGSYFAVDPVYSAQGYAAPDTNGHKRMYQARVLVGDFTKGRPGLISPPSKSSTSAADLYDSVSDNPTNPTMFVIFSDIQAYPEYLIKFT
ncbi:protein mono-ADP-ribosyltransferase PARP14-like isoform X2 [Mugil cephalus]|uniref:protein mono-ADP-ribosyltransferase PARP14-like isoform X2 n=1 Tax=Mugil cephalus TaxID=48193 RepID=UPI001FB81517|nr:protein mono-ADP-ribosyltransferase PARP14-like isoform X2 [Mugil cephalus]